MTTKEFLEKYDSKEKFTGEELEKIYYVQFDDSQNIEVVENGHRSHKILKIDNRFFYIENSFVAENIEVTEVERKEKITYEYVRKERV